MSTSNRMPSSGEDTSDYLEDDDDQYDVEAIRDWRYVKKDNSLEFLVKWTGYSEEDNSWEPAYYLNCPELLEKFKRELSSSPRKCLESKNHRKLSGFQRNAKFLRCLAGDGSHDSDDEDSPKANKQRFYIWVLFEDSPKPEEVTLSQLFKHNPEAAFTFCEQRCLAKS